MSSSSDDPAVLGIGLVTSVGVERWVEGDLAAATTPDHVEGFPALVAAPSQSEAYCAVEVDVARGQLLDVQFLDAGHQPPVQQAELCFRARTAAEAAVETLLAR